MCGRFTQNYTWEQVHAFLSVFGAPRNLRPYYNIPKRADPQSSQLNLHWLELTAPPFRYELWDETRTWVAEGDGMTPVTIRSWGGKQPFDFADHRPIVAAYQVLREPSPDAAASRLACHDRLGRCAGEAQTAPDSRLAREGVWLGVVCKCRFADHLCNCK